MPAPSFFVVRTDVSGDSGSQRVFGAYDAEQDAAAFAMQIASSMYGEFAVVGPALVALSIARENGVQAVRAVHIDADPIPDGGSISL